MIDVVYAVDWSAAARPARGRDSIWIARAPVGPTAEIDFLENPPTRSAAIAALRDQLRALGRQGRRAFIGFDFPFGFPAGAAARITGRTGAGWSQVWSHLASMIEDGPDNANNRFAVAAQINRTSFDGEGPFWGRPAVIRSAAARDALHGLPAKKPLGYAGKYPAERRMVEELVRSAQPVWKLFTTGSVGSQALMGVAALERLRGDREFRDQISIWPFETRFENDLSRPITLAEIYPSLMSPDPREAVKDAGQVRRVAETFARQIAEAGPQALLSRRRSLSGSMGRLEAVLDEEGWIVGV